MPTWSINACIKLVSELRCCCLLLALNLCCSSVSFMKQQQLCGVKCETCNTHNCGNHGDRCALEPHKRLDRLAIGSFPSRLRRSSAHDNMTGAVTDDCWTCCRHIHIHIVVQFFFFFYQNLLTFSRLQKRKKVSADRLLNATLDS